MSLTNCRAHFIGKLIVGAVLLVVFQQTAVASQVQRSDFSPAAVVQTYDGLNLIGSPATPLVIGADTYASNNGLARYLGGEALGTTGGAFGTQSELGWVDITLATPALRAGMDVGLNFPWTIDVSFFDASNSLLAALRLSGEANQPQFAGWQSDNALIRRVRVADPKTDNLIVAFDDFIQEVPEPNALGLVVMAGALPAARRQRPWHLK
jgi:hypothetical protein